MDNFDSLKPKSFWEKPEGTTGMVFGSLLVLGGGYLLYKVFCISVMR